MTPTTNCPALPATIYAYGYATAFQRMCRSLSVVRCRVGR